MALTLTQLSAEFGVSESKVRFSTCALFVGLCIGASFWGIASDVIGRRPAFNLTLFITGVFGLAAGGAPNWVGVSALYACLGLGVGGNLPVDGALFLEFLPFASGNLLTMLSVWWPTGTLIARFVQNRLNCELILLIKYVPVWLHGDLCLPIRAMKASKPAA